MVKACVERATIFRWADNRFSTVWLNMWVDWQPSKMIVCSGEGLSRTRHTLWMTDREKYSAPIYHRFLIGWGPNSLAKGMSCLTAYSEDLFLVVKACLEPATLYGWADNWGMMLQCVTHYLVQQSLSKTGLPYQGLRT